MRNKWLSIVFMIVIMLIPVITIVSCIFSYKSGLEERLAGLSPGAAVNVFLDSVPVKEDFARFNTKLTRKITGAAYIKSTQVTLGKNGWLYLKEAQSDYEHTNCFSEEEKQKILEQLLFQKEVFADSGMEFVIYIAPNKATIYPENMPDTVFQRDSLSRAEDLIKYIRDNSDIKVIYPKEELMAAKEIAPIYYVTDTHWNEVGGYVGTQVFLKEVFGFEDRLSADMISIREEYREGDLARIGSVSDIYKEYTLYGIKPLSIDMSLKSDKSVYFVGDSFRDAMGFYLPHYVEKVAFLHYNDYNCRTMFEYEPDIVVWEIVERNINKYLELNLAEDVFYGADGKMRYLPSDLFCKDEYGVRYQKDGVYVADSLIETDGEIYYFDESGYMVFEYLKTIGEYTYYFDTLGEAKQGWLIYEGEYYYFDEEFHMVKGDWVRTPKDEWYYMTDDGSMLRNAYTPDGYYVNENGQWLQ